MEVIVELKTLSLSTTKTTFRNQSDWIQSHDLLTFKNILI